MDLLSLILFCALSSSPQSTTLVHQIAQSVEGDPLHIDDLTDAAVYAPASAREAAGIVRALLEAGHDLRVGLAQIPARVAWQDYGLSPDQMLSACTNVAVGTDLLTRAHSRYPKAEQALAYYLTSDPADDIGLGWAFSVLTHEQVDLAEHAFDVESPQPSRRYVIDTTQPIFVGRSPSPGQLPRARPVGHLFVVDPGASRRSGEPKKWAPVDPAGVSSGTEEVARPTSSSSPQRSAARGGRPRPQPDVTDERLLTSEELSRKEVR